MTSSWFFLSTTLGSPLFWWFPSDHIPERRRMSVYISLFTVAIHVNYTSEFRELFAATTQLTSQFTNHIRVAGQQHLNHWAATQQAALTCAQIHAGEQTADPRRLPLSLPEVLNKLPQKDAESVGYAIDDHVAHKTGEHNDPAIPAIWGWWQIMVFAIWGTLFIRRATFGVSSSSTVRCEG